LFNRGAGILTLWAMGFVVWQALKSRERTRRLLWQQQGIVSVAQRMMGERDAEQIGALASAALCEWLGALTAVLYRLDEDGALLRSGGHALDAQAAPARIEPGQGLLGQVLADGRPRVVADVGAGHLAIASALGRSLPRHVLVAPVTAGGSVCGVIELGFTRAAGDFETELELLRRVAERIGVALRSALYRERLETLLEQTQRQRLELQSQQEELRVSNEELEQQSRVLQDSQARLETQQVELEQANVQLEERSQVLERQKRELLDAQQALHANAERLEAASRYKSEFLANMSHELRTPLNSALILSKLLADNKEGTLTAEQVRYAQAIHASNNDLLALINDILDLSKIEAGHAELVAEPLALQELLGRLRATFEPLARQKALAFSVEVMPGAPATLHSDGQRLAQVLRNLLANALKFTGPDGRVTVRLLAADGFAELRVEDTGEGLDPDTLQHVFRPFYQAQSRAMRSGLGLGLSIVGELVELHGGTVEAQSPGLGRGATFIVRLPMTRVARSA
ncbi:MAG TPA: ATP-binding protein, partial [Burkholderiaceae bacterium]|nr:ATP-binding protein [Burkholderiaceae bacterium]